MTESVHYYVPGAASRLLKKVLEGEQSVSLCDIGCGDGAKLFVLRDAGLLAHIDRIVGVDISSKRIATFKQNFEGARGVVCDASGENLANLVAESFDRVICASTIQYVPSDTALLTKIFKLLRQYGLCYISTVNNTPAS